MNANRFNLEQLETRWCLDSTVVFNELMYNPGPDQDLEWIELHNQMAVDMDLSNWRFDGVDYIFPQGTVLARGDYLVIASSPVAFAGRNGATSVLGPYEGRLNNSGETIRLINNNDRIMDQVAYDDRWPWPVGADGSGSTLSKMDENESSEDAEHWLSSEQIGGTPGSPNRHVTDAVLSEIMVVDEQTVWRYDDRGIDYGTSWLAPGFDPNDPNRDGNADDAWMAGSNGFADAFHAEAKSTRTSTLRADSTTHYFRTEFLIENPDTAQLVLHIAADDGAVIYLNGREVSRVNMPAGRIEFDTLAMSDRTTPLTVETLVLSTEFIESGSNVLSVEVHQAVRTGPPDVEFADDQSPVTSDGLLLAQEGPVVDSILSLAPINLATGASPFALDELGLGIHFATNVNDRRYGNNHSWVGNRLVGSEGAFIGLNLGKEPIPDIQSIAFGRSNVAKGEPCPGEICTNRTLGQYKIQFTRAPNPDTSVTTTEDPSTGWATIGTLDYDAQSGPSFQNPHQRHRYNFAPVTATGFRILVPNVGIALGTGIDEIELYDRPFVSESLDVFFSSTLTATEMRPIPSKLTFHEVAAVDDSPFFIEVINHNPVPIDLGQYVLMNRRRPEDSIRIPDFRLQPNQRYVLPSTELTRDLQVGDVLFLYGPGQTTLADAVIVSNRLQARSTERGSRWLAPDGPTPGTENRFSFPEDIVINEIAYNAGTLPATPAQGAQYVDELVVPFDATWRHTKSFSLFGNDRAVDPGPNWADQAHAVDEVNWLSGQAPMGVTTSRLPLRINRRFGEPENNSQFIATYYFELEFTLTQEQLDATNELLLRHLIDDGAVFYLNGHEVHRFQMRDGTPNASTLASRCIDNAAISRPISIRADGLVSLPEVNRFSVEVHQAIPTGNDILFAAELSRRELLRPATAAVPSVRLEEEWIELFNRSDTTTVDLSHWQFRDGIQFSFPQNTLLGPQEFLVVARDRGAFVEKYPDVDRAIGDYSGRLSNQGEHVEIVDARGNPVDEVHYRERGRWPEYADGGHSTLELRDPWADNSIPEAWAASIESSRSHWQSYSYRGIVQPDGFTNGVSTRYQELIIGLLDAGEVMLDDISVIEDPGGVAIERIQNGSFEADGIGSDASTWRIGGNHSGLVISDPIDPDNHVLHLTATGAMEDRLNHAETTFADRARIRQGVEYQVSFRAKWIGGSNQLNTHLYFNRLARTTLVARDEQMGTPGRANSVLISNMGPTFKGLRHSPVVPDSHQPVRVFVIARDPDGVVDARLWYSVDDGPFKSMTMGQMTGDEFHAEIPGQETGATVQFYVQATDVLGISSTFPAKGPDSRALFRVQDGRAKGGLAHDFRIIMTPADTAWLHDRTNQMSNRLMGATVVYNETQVFHDVGVRLKGSNAGRANDPYLGFHVRFDPVQPFRGVHESVAIDRSGRSGPVSQGQDEILIKHIINHAGGVPGMYDDLIHVIAPNRRHDRSALLMMARYGNEFLDSQFENGSDGTVFKLDIAYVPNQTVRRDPESLKVAFPYSHPSPAKDLEDLGDDKEAYRAHLLIRNRRAADDYNRIIEASRVLDLRGDELIDQIESVIDVDQWARTFAIQSLSGAADAYTQGSLHHNIAFYVRPNDQRVLALPWDWDFAFTQSPTGPLIGTVGNGGQLFRVPQFRRLYHQHLLDVIETTFNNEYLDLWIEHYGSVARQNFRPIKAYVAARGAHVSRRLPDTIDFQIDAAKAMVTDQGYQIAISGQGWIDVASIRVAGTDSLLDVRWIGDKHWEATLTVGTARNRIELRAQNRHGEAVGINGIDVEFLDSPPLPGDVNGDRRFDELDIVQVLQAGKYLTHEFTTFIEGDWNGDGVFDQLDIVLALQQL